jgi:DNA (cytosine-5)-methyltransferase 1
LKEMNKEHQIITVGYMNDGKHQQDFVQHEDGISRAICCGTHGSGPHLTKTMVSVPLRIPQATAQGYVEVEPGSLFDGSYPNSKTRRGRVQDNGQSRTTLTANGEPPYYYEGTEEWKTIIGNKQMNPFRGDVEEISPCITSACGAGGGMTPMLTDAELETTKTKDFIEQVRRHQPINYRIRKLTPREVFRLMGVTETNIDKIQNSGVSQSQQYKMAGNSIVVDVLEHIFRKMFVDTAQESQQLSLF